MKFTVSGTDYDIDLTTLTVGELVHLEETGLDPAPLLDGVPRDSVWKYTRALIWLVRTRAGEQLAIDDVDDVNALDITFHRATPASRRPPAKAPRAPGAAKRAPAKKTPSRKA